VTAGRLLGEIAVSEPFEIRYANEAVANLKAMRVYDQRIILAGIQTHLQYEPKTESKSRIRALAQPFWSQCRLRIDERARLL
jgi:hypothetical protein